MIPVNNPFHDLWITEYLDPQGFVSLFSPIVAEDSNVLFSAGNVVIKGRQGSGKSMLLSLLETRTRVAYGRSNVEYPAKVASRTFISAGVNLTRDNARLVVSRVDEVAPDRRRSWVAATFADYVNYLISIDLISNVEYLAAEQEKDGVLRGELDVNWSPECRASFVSALKSSDEWYGYLGSCITVEDVLERCRERLLAYRRYFNFNADLPDDISQSRTEIGQPVAVIADALRSSGVLPTEVSVLIRLDQHEELFVLERISGYGEVFRQVINRALAQRDKRIAYRIGTRHYAWDDRIEVWGSGASLENLRDYVALDIDEYFRRPESLAVEWKFPRFAEDVFRRRLIAARFDLSNIPLGKTLDHVFGETLLPAERARRYARGSSPKIRPDVGWSPAWTEVLTDMWHTDPLSARLGEAFLRQRSQSRTGLAAQAPAGELPWLHDDRKWWRKERLEVAAMQIASECNQSLIWSGRKHIVELSGWNI